MSSIFTGSAATRAATRAPASPHGLALVTRVWRRHFDAFLRVWHTESTGILGEPIFALAAFGAGLAYLGGGSVFG